MKQYLETERLIMTFMEKQDGYLMHDLDSNPNVTKYVGQGQMQLEDYDGVIQRIRKYYDKDNGMYGFFNAYKKEDMSYIGWFHIRPGKDDPENWDDLEVGYRLKEEYWKNGFGTEGTKAILSKIFNETNCMSIFAIADFSNQSSWHIMEKCGMKFEKRFDYMGFDCVQYRISRMDYFLLNQ